MYVSDYGYATTPDNWNTVLGDYHLAADYQNLINKFHLLYLELKMI